MHSSPNGVSFIKEIGAKYVLDFIGFRKHVIDKLQQNQLKKQNKAIDNLISMFLLCNMC